MLMMLMLLMLMMLMMLMMLLIADADADADKKLLFRGSRLRRCEPPLLRRFGTKKRPAFLVKGIDRPLSIKKTRLARRKPLKFSKFPDSNLHLSHNRQQ
jgi:hypothetical protein